MAQPEPHLEGGAGATQDGMPASTGFERAHLTQSTSVVDSLLREVASTCISVSVSTIVVVPQMLVQLGYEPLPAIRYTNLLGWEGWLRPNCFKYSQILVQRHGYGVFFTGLPCRVVSTVVYSRVYNAVAEAVEGALPGQPSAEAEDDSVTNKTLGNLAVTAAAKCAAGVVSHPICLLEVRLVAQLLGGAQLYRSFPFGLVDIYQGEGFGGLFRGLAATVVANLVSAAVMTAATALLQEYVIPFIMTEPAKEGLSGETTSPLADDASENAVLVLRQHTTAHLAKFISGDLVYPLELSKTLMMVNGTNLAAASLNPHFDSFIDCVKYLHLQPPHRGLKRGQSMIRRFSWVE